MVLDGGYTESAAATIECVRGSLVELITLAIREEGRRDSPGWIGRVIESIEADLSVTPTLGSLPECMP